MIIENTPDSKKGAGHGTGVTGQVNKHALLTVCEIEHVVRTSSINMNQIDTK